MTSVVSSAVHAVNTVLAFYVFSMFPRARTGYFIGGKTEGSKAESGGEVLGEGAATPPHQLGRLGECCEFPQRSSGRSPDRSKVFHYFQHS